METNRAAMGPFAVRILFVGLAFLLATFELADFDIWWHLRTGQLIAERGTVPETDWYSFQAAGQEWLDVHWGFQLLFSWLHERFGVPGMVLAKAWIAALATAFALSAYRKNWSPTVQILIWFPAIFLMSSRFYVRPEILTLLFTAIFLTVLFHAEERPAWLWMLPLIQMLWANVQGLFSFGPILIAMYLVEATLRAGRTRGIWRHLAPVSLLVPAACLVSPYGVRNVLFPLELWLKLKPGENIFRQHVAELQDFPTFWRQGGFVNPYAILFVFVGFLGAASMLLAARRILLERRAFWVLAPIGFTYLGLQAIRNGNHFALVVGTTTAWCLGSLTESSRKPRLLGALLCSGLIAAAGFAVLSGHWYAIASPDRRIGLENRQSFNSPQAMRLAGQEGMPERAAIFNFGHAGEYIFFNGPRRQVYFDGRLEVFTEQQFRDFLALEAEIAGTSAHWDAQLQSARCDLAIVDGEHNHAMQAGFWAHPAWNCIHYDEVVAVFLRKSFPQPAGIRVFDFVEACRTLSADVIEDLPVDQTPEARSWWRSAGSFKDKSDLLAERACHLGLGFASRPTVDARAKFGNAVYALRNAETAIRRRPQAAECWRVRGIATYLAAMAIDSQAKVESSRSTWSPDCGLLLAQAASAFQRAARCNPNDYSSNFYLYLFAKQADALDAAQLYLRRCTRITASNIARQKLQAELEDDLRKLDAKIAEIRGRHPSADGADAFKQIDAGLALTGLESLDHRQPEDLTDEQVDLWGTLLMRFGRADRAEQLFASQIERRPASRKRFQLRLGQCQICIGRHAAAAANLAACGSSYECAFAIAWLHVAAGRYDALRGLVKDANGGDWTEEQRRRFAVLVSFATDEKSQ